MSEEEKLIIEINKTDDKLDTDFPPSLWVKKENEEEKTLFTQSPQGDICIGVKDLKVREGIRRSPQLETSTVLSYTGSSIQGMGSISNVKQYGSGLTDRGDAIKFFGSDVSHQKIGVEIICQDDEFTKDEISEDIELRGKDITEYDSIQLQGIEGSISELDEFYLIIILRNRSSFEELLRRARVGEVSTLGITIYELDKVPGLYLEHEDEYSYHRAKTFHILKDKKYISNLSDEEISELSEGSGLVDSFSFQLDSKFSLSDFYIEYNAHWVIDDLFSGSDFTDIEDN